MALVTHGLLILAMLRRQPATLTQICRRLGCKKSNTVYYQRDKLLREGLIRREGRILRVTPAGDTVLEALSSLDPECLQEWTR